MKKTGKKPHDPDMLPEYDFRGGVRGKHVARYRQKTAAEIIAEVASKSVNHGRIETSSRDHDQVLYGKQKASCPRKA